jgi:hypothetical protein
MISSDFLAEKTELAPGFFAPSDLKKTLIEIIGPGQAGRRCLISCLIIYQT